MRDESLAKSRGRSESGLKGRNIPAEGNALGIDTRDSVSPLRAPQMHKHTICYALSGLMHEDFSNPGRCPGLICNCPFGAKNMPTDFLRKNQEPGCRCEI